MAPSRAAGPSDLKLFQMWMDLTKRTFVLTARFPKQLRHTLTERIEQLTLEILEDLTSAAYQAEKARVLQAANDRLNRLRVLVRLAHEMQVISHGQYEELVTAMAEAGRLLGGWLRQQQGRRRVAPGQASPDNQFDLATAQ
jgi:hypothetical protein